MGGDGTFKVVSQAIRTAGTNILTDTTTLATQTHTLLGQIDDTCKSLPTSIYQILEGSFLSWQALLDRSDQERERLGKTLQVVAQAVEQEEQKIKQSFTPKPK